MQLQRDPAEVLPSELICAFFAFLDLKGCIAVSHVSRSWRNAALSDRSLWNEYTVPNDPSCVGAHAGLRTMLLRSSPAPFRLTCSADVPDALVELLVQNMHRMQVLRLSIIRPGTVTRLMAQNAPLLEVFSYYWSPEPNTVIPLTWSDVHAPLLREVRILQFTIPGDSEYSSINSFSGTLPTGYSLPRPLASVFPVLTEMYLHGITQASLDLLLPLPPGMTSMTLSSATSEPIDYAGFLRGCAPVTLSRLHLDSATSTSVAPVVDAFTRAAADGPWELHLGGHGFMELRAEPAVSYVAFCYQHEPLTSLTSTILRVSTLSLFAAHYADLYRSSRTLPALTRLVLGVRVRRAAVLPADRFELGGGAPVGAPALDSIEIKIHDSQARDAVLALPYVAPLVRSLACPRLADLALHAARPGQLLDADLSCLAGLAPRILVADLEGNDSVPVCTTISVA